MKAIFYGYLIKVKKRDIDILLKIKIVAFSIKSYILMVLYNDIR